MFVSGLTIESKKISISRKSQVPKLEQHRPSSTELPEIPDIRAFTLNKIPQPPRQHDKNRNSSHNKIQLHSRTQQRVHEPLKEYNTQNRILSRPQKKDLTPPIKRQKRNDLSKEEEFDFAGEDRLLAFFRYYPLVIVGAAGMREEMMRSLGESSEITVYAPKGKKLAKKGLQELWNKLLKLASLKGKYKFRQKFNFLISPQLKALSYKRKQAKKKKQSDSSSSDDQTERKQKCRDMETWKKSMGVEGCKVFIVKGKYKDLRNALLQRGWVQNQDVQSLFYDLKWTTKVNDVNFETVKSHQMVNHFNNNACLTSKYGICKSLRSIMYSEGVDVDKFFPKAFDISDIQDFENFLQIYKWIACQSGLKRILLQAEPSLEDQIKAKVAYAVTSRRLLGADKLLTNLVNSRLNLCSINEWKFLTGSKEGNIEGIHQLLQQWQLLELPWEAFKNRLKDILSRLRQREPQFSLNGSANIWIVKPAFLSRGRGIKCLSELPDILDYSLGKETQYVVQKYIENPLIINRKKFDIRQWVIVQDYAPPKIWFYSEFYCRFCLDDYNPSKLGNRFAHLTNNSIQKYNSKVNAQELQNDSMWNMDQLSAFVEKNYGEGKFKQIVSKMKEIVVATIISTMDQVYGRKNSFELIGYDFMIDQDLNPWLIEINSSPSMDYSTPVTRRLVKMVLEDTVKVVVDLKKKKSKKKTAGLFKLIYDGQSKYEFKRYRLGLEEP